MAVSFAQLNYRAQSLCGWLIGGCVAIAFLLPFMLAVALVGMIGLYGWQLLTAAFYATSDKKHLRYLLVQLSLWALVFLIYQIRSMPYEIDFIALLFVGISSFVSLFFYHHNYHRNSALAMEVQARQLGDPSVLDDNWDL